MIGVYNVDSTNDAVAVYLASKGIPVYGWQGMSQSEYQGNLALVRGFEAGYYILTFTLSFLLGPHQATDGPLTVARSGYLPRVTA